MAATLKVILDQVLTECGFPKKSAYVASTNPADQQLVSIADSASAYLALQGVFPTLQALPSLLAGATTITLIDLAMFVVPDTLSQNNARPIVFPTPPHVWNEVTANGGSEGYARMVNDRTIELSKGYASNTSLRYHYVRFPISSSGGTVFGLKFVADDASWDLDTRMIESEIKWRLKREKGLPYEDDRNEAILYRNNVRSSVFSARTLTDGADIRHSLMQPRIRGIDDYY